MAFAQIGITCFDRQIEHEALRLYGLPKDAPAVLYGCPSLPAGTHSLSLETNWDLPSLAPYATANVDITVHGARRGGIADCKAHAEQAYGEREGQQDIQNRHHRPPLAKRRASASSD